MRSKHDVGDYQYGTNAGPHAVTSAGVHNYYYDANGNLTSDSQGRSLDYTVFDKPHRIEKGDYVSEFWYGPDRGRYMRIDNDGSVNSRDYHYLLKDHLGSVDLILGQIIYTGTEGQTLSFDPWGQRRHPDTLNNLIQSYSILELVAEGGLNEVTNRGFTGHEMLDGTGLIHMNGRVFDPRLARFVSADPLIQAPENTQSYNRYSYTFNNPLKYTDPSGYSAFDQLFDFFADNPIVGAMVQTVGCAATGPFCPAFVGAFSAAQTYHLTGDIGLAFKSGVIAGMSALAFHEIGSSGMGRPERILAHGMVGGLTSVAQGGDFGTGFLTSAVTKAVNVNDIFKADELAFLRISTAAIIGGTISEATGGKFASGAVTAAFAQILNGEKERTGTAQKKWGTKDFVKHYFSGDGKEVNLGDVGLGEDFQNTPQVQKAE